MKVTTRRCKSLVLYRPCQGEGEEGEPKGFLFGSLCFFSRTKLSWALSVRIHTDLGFIGPFTDLGFIGPSKFLRITG